MTFGELEKAEASAKKVRRIHDKIVGQLYPAPPYEENHEYTAHHEGVKISFHSFFHHYCRCVTC